MRNRVPRLFALPFFFALIALLVLPAYAQESSPQDFTAAPGSVLADNLLVTWYGNPHTGLMGVLGQFAGEDLAHRLQRQADAFSQVTDKQVLRAYELVAVVAQDNAGSDGMWRRRESEEVIDSMLEQARAAGFKLILDTYQMVMEQPLEFAGVKLFCDQDPNLFTPEQVMQLDPAPSVVIYQ